MKKLKITILVLCIFTAFFFAAQTSSAKKQEVKSGEPYFTNMPKINPDKIKNKSEYLSANANYAFWIKENKDAILEMYRLYIGRNNDTNQTLLRHLDAHNAIVDQIRKSDFKPISDADMAKLEEIAKKYIENKRNEQEAAFWMKKFEQEYSKHLFKKDKLTSQLLYKIFSQYSTNTSYFMDMFINNKRHWQSLRRTLWLEENIASLRETIARVWPDYDSCEPLKTSYAHYEVWKLEMDCSRSRSLIISPQVKNPDESGAAGAKFEVSTTNLQPDYGKIVTTIDPKSMQRQTTWTDNLGIKTRANGTAPVSAYLEKMHGVKKLDCTKFSEKNEGQQNTLHKDSDIDGAIKDLENTPAN